MTTTGAHCLIECSDQPLDISFHPTKNSIVAAGLVDGTVEVHDFEELLDARPSNSVAAAVDGLDDDEVDTIVSSSAIHTQMLPSKSSDSGMRKAVCRAVHFSADGSTLYTGGSGGDLAGLDASRITTFNASSGGKGAINWRCPNSSYGKGGIQVIHEFQQRADAPGESSMDNAEQSVRALLATGDEVGGVRIWDPRLVSMEHQNPSGSNESVSLKKPRGCIHSWKLHEDYISGIANSADGNTVLASSADCTISAYDLRMASQHNQPLEKIARRSDDQEDEMLSIQVMKNGRKVVCGSGEGVLSIFSWGTWGDVSDRFPGHPASVDALLPIDQETLLTGSSDGLIRVVQVHPNKLLGVLGDHDGFPIEKLKFNANRNFVGSITHDTTIRIWDARILQDDFEMEQEEIPGGESAESLLFSGVEKTGKTEKDGNSDDDWEDMDADMDEDMEEAGDDDDSDSDDDDVAPSTKNDRRKNRLKTEREKFYEDL